MTIMVFKSEHLQTPKDSFVGLRQNRILSKKWTHFSKSQWKPEGSFKAPFSEYNMKRWSGVIVPQCYHRPLYRFKFWAFFSSSSWKEMWSLGQVVHCCAWQVMSARLGRCGGIEQKQEKWVAIMLTHCQNNSVYVAMILRPRRGRGAGGQTVPSIGNRSHVWQKPYGPWQGAVWEHMWVIPWMEIWHGAAGWQEEWQTRASGIGNCYPSPC